MSHPVKCDICGRFVKMSNGDELTWDTIYHPNSDPPEPPEFAIVHKTCLDKVYERGIQE